MYISENTIIVPMTETVTMEVPNGHLHIYVKDDSYYVEYHNKTYIGSPFLLSNQFSTDFSIDEIVKSSEVMTLIRRVTKGLPKRGPERETRL